MSTAHKKQEAQVDWQTVVPLGDTLCVRTGSVVDADWAKAFEVVLQEHQHRTTPRDWGQIDFEYGSGDHKHAPLVLYIRAIKPGARSADLRRTLDGLVRVSNTVAAVGPHVYELARELREPPA